MEMLDVVLLVLGAISFLVAALGVPVNRVNPVALGLLFWILVPLVHALDVLSK